MTLHTLRGVEPSLFLWYRIMFIVDQQLFISPIPNYLFKKLETYAFDALEKKEHTGDSEEVALKEEYNMDGYPEEFEKWVAETIDLYFHKHTAKEGFYGIDDRHLKIQSIWTNRMTKGDVHKPHCHKGCLYAFVAYIRTGPEDAGFCYMFTEETGKIAITSVPVDEQTQGHILIFPADMPHTVYPKTNDGERISVSGNICCYVDGGYVD